MSVSSSNGRFRGRSDVGRDRERQRPAFPTRIRARLLRFRLDRRLAAGERPSESPELRWRAVQLTSPEHRQALADEIEWRLEEARHPARGLSAAVPLNKPGILALEDELRRLADDLRGPEPVEPRGVILMEQMLHDGASPMFASASEADLERALRVIRIALLLR